VSDPLVVLGAMMVEGALGYPDRLHARVPHPVVWLGKAIGGLDKAWNNPTASERQRKVLGVATVLIVAGGAGLVGLAFNFALPAILVALVGAVGLAARSLYDHVAAVLKALQADDLPAARLAVGRIVGRDTAELDEPGVATAALESLAESFSDGVVAPVFWFLIAGLGGLFVYKAVNTADSMIGHIEPRWRAFGWAAAKIDDMMNWIPARLTGGLIVLVGMAGFGVMLRDAPRHASPNAGWPEAAMAGALGVQVGGPVRYDGMMTDRPTFGDGRPPTTAVLARGLKLYVHCLAVIAGLLLFVGVAWRL
jgi:adenosylcobinamide-phosphate synthase